MTPHSPRHETSGPPLLLRQGMHELLEGSGAGHDYVAFICDVWGVLHDGVSPYPGAAECLAKLRASGRPVILLSNAPRPSHSIMPQLQGFGFMGAGPAALPGAHYDAIITSGDAVRSAIEGGYYGRTMMHLGPDRDLPLLDGLDIEFAGPGNAHFVLNTGLYDDTNETPDDYRELLSELHRRHLPMLCANPDEIVMRGGNRIYCAGALARAYAALGGAVTYFGKPFPGVYQLCLNRITRLLGRDTPPEQALCIGDGLHTDIAGAQAFGMGSLFVSGGIHGAELQADGSGAPLDREKLLRACQAGNLAPPDAVIHRLIW